VPRGGMGIFFFRQYIEGTRFTVSTDHAALKWMLHLHGAHGRLARWRSRWALLDYVVQTRPGSSHHAADTMSRISTRAGDYGPIPDAGTLFGPTRPFGRVAVAAADGGK